MDKRERILAAAAELIVRNGLQCSMAEIAMTAGIATGSLYNYFKSKDDLIWGVYERLTQTVAAALVVEHDPATPHEVRIRRYIGDYIDFIWSDPDRAILFEYLSNVPLIPANELRRAFAPVTTFTNKLIEDARAAGVLRNLPVQDMGGFIGGGIRNTLKWHRAAGARLTPGERDNIAVMCWSAIASDSCFLTQ